MTSIPAVPRDEPDVLRLALAAGLGGALGGVARHLAGVAASGDDLLVVTLSINAVGCLLLGLLPLVDRVGRSETWRVAVGPGMLGGFTTLSAVNEQAREVLADGRLLLAAGYLLGTLAVCVGAAGVAARVVARRYGP